MANQVFKIQHSANVVGTLNVSGNTSLGGILSINTAATSANIAGDLQVSGNATIGGGITIVGTTTYTSNLVPVSNGVTSIGNTTKYWANLHVLNALVDTELKTNTGTFALVVNVGSNVSMNTTAIYLGNSITNVSINSSAISATGNVTASGLTGSGLSSLLNLNVTQRVNTASFYASTTANVGSNVQANTTALLIGNATVNTVILSTGIDTDGTLAVLGATTISNTLAAGNTSITGTLSAGNTTISGNLAAGQTALGNLAVSGTFSAGNTTISGTTASGNTTITGFANISQTLAVTNTATFSNNVTVGGNMTVSGNLIVSGTTTYVNTATLNIADNIVTLNADLVGAPTENAGIEVNRGTSANVSIEWNETSDKWTFSNDGSTYLQIASNNDVTANAATAYSNAIAYSGNAAQAYANAIAYSGNAALAYANAIAYSANASNLGNGTVPSARISGSYTSITGVGTITTGTWQGTSISTSYTDAKVSSITTGNGLTGGPITSSGTISVLANTGIVANATGVYVNSTYIATLTANNASNLGGVAAASYAQLASPSFTGTVTVTGTVDTASANVKHQTISFNGAGMTWDTSLGQVATVTLTGNAQLDASNLKVGNYILHVIQDATGSRNLTYTSKFKWTAGVAPICSSAPASRDVFSFTSDGTNMYGAMIPDVRS